MQLIPVFIILLHLKFPLSGQKLSYMISMYVHIRMYVLVVLCVQLILCYVILASPISLPPSSSHLPVIQFMPDEMTVISSAHFSEVTAASIHCAQYYYVLLEYGHMFSTEMHFISLSSQSNNSVGLYKGTRRFFSLRN